MNSNAKFTLSGKYEIDASGGGYAVVDGDSIALMDGATLTLLDDLRLEDLAMPCEDSVLVLDGFDLSIAGGLHRDGKAWAGKIDCASGGRIFWAANGFMILVR